MSAVHPSTYGLSTDDLKSLIDKGFSCKSHDEVKEGVLNQMDSLGGLTGIAERLKSSITDGLVPDNNDIAARRSYFGVNKMPDAESRSIFMMMFDALKDPTILILIGCALLGLITGMIFENPATAWMEPVAILAAVAAVVLVASLNDYKKEKQFRALNAIVADLETTVIRGGQQVAISVFDIVVGDLVMLNTGDVVPTDGLFVKGFDMLVNESSMTGETDDLKKGHYEFNDGKTSKSPFLFSGTQVMNGDGLYLALAVGINSQAGQITSMITEAEETITPMQAKLNNLAALIGKVGLVVSTLCVIVMISVWLANFVPAGRPYDSGADTRSIIHAFIIGITVLVVAVPEGLPLAVTIAMAYSVLKMLKDNNLVRHLAACETMGGATTICSDKTGTLTTNRMTVMKAWLCDGLHNPIPQHIDSLVKEKLFRSVAINSSAKSKIQPSTDGIAPPEQIGNKTECALLGFVSSMGCDYEAIRSEIANLSEADTSQLCVFTFDSTRKRMSTVVPEGGKKVLYCKGAAEYMLGRCTHYYTATGTVEPMGESTRKGIETAIDQFANETLRTICLAMRDVTNVPLDTVDDVERSMTCLCVVGIEDPVRAEVPFAIQKCNRAGITVRMVTGDNIVTAKAIAKKCGILQNDSDVAMEGPDFRARVLDSNGELDQAEFDKVWPSLRVLARSSPADKYVLVTGLKKTAVPQVVAVTGDGTNDGPALKQANVGFAMNSGTSIAKDASDIVLMDDNFNSVVEAVKWGRNVYDAIGKFLQFQLTVNIVAITMAALGACVLNDSPLTPVQLLWVNMIMDTLAALALSTDPPNEALLDRKPYSKNRPLLSKIMLRNMLGHSFYQIVVLCVILWAGPLIFKTSGANCFPKFGPCDGRTNYIPGGELSQICYNDGCLGHKKGYELPPIVDADGWCPIMSGNPCTHDGHIITRDASLHYAIVFNTFVLMQIFNEINARKIHNELNVFEGITKNSLYIGIQIGSMIVQVLFVQFGGVFLSIPPGGLGWDHWLWCLLFGVLVLPWQVLLHFIVPPSMLIDKEVADPLLDYESETTPTDKGDGKRRSSFAQNAARALWARGIKRTHTHLIAAKAFRAHGDDRRARGESVEHGTPFPKDETKASMPGGHLAQVKAGNI